jgi:hypothetical protein
MRNTISAVVFCLLAVLSAAGLPAAAEPQDDEKITMPRPVFPGQSGTVAPPESPGGATVLTPAPAREADQSGPVTVVPPPATPDDSAAGQSNSPSTVTVVPLPASPGGAAVLTPAPAREVPPAPEKTVILPVEIPAIPEIPKPPDKTLLATPPLQQETAPPKATVVAPRPALPQPGLSAAPGPDKPASPADFLLMPTPLTPDKASPPESTAGKETPPVKKAAPEEPQTPQAAAKPKSGAPLRIPPGAAKTGNLAFLEGCWRGTRPEYYTKRIITERFCFDKNGVGKRTIEDPQYAGRCTGAAKGGFDAQGKLVVTSEQGYCTGGMRWGQAHMVCQEEGNSSPCFWRFPDAGGGTQSYKIPLVRE